MSTEKKEVVREIENTKVAKEAIEDAQMVEEVNKEQDVNLKLSLDSANGFIGILDAILIGSDLLKPIKTHFITMIKSQNEETSEQSTE